MRFTGLKMTLFRRELMCMCIVCVMLAACCWPTFACSTLCSAENRLRFAPSVRARVCVIICWIKFILVVDGGGSLMDNGCLSGGGVHLPPLSLSYTHTSTEVNFTPLLLLSKLPKSSMLSMCSGKITVTKLSKLLQKCYWSLLPSVIIKQINKILTLLRDPMMFLY